MNNEEREIDLVELFLTLLRRWWAIGLVAILCGGAGLCLSMFVVEPTYESTTSVYVVNKQGESMLTYSDLQLGSQLTKDYVVLTTSRTVMEQVISELSLDMTVEDLRDCIAVSTVSDTRIMNIKVTYTDPAMAQAIANKTRNAAAEHIKQVMEVEEVNVAEYANFPFEKAAPSIAKWTLLGGVLGGFIMIALFTMLFLLNDKIKTSEDVEKYLGVSTLGSIPYSNVLEKMQKADSKRKKKGGKKHAKDRD